MKRRTLWALHYAVRALERDLNYQPTRTNDLPLLRATIIARTALRCAKETPRA